MMYDEDEPLIRVMSLAALLYCERLFYLEEVEDIQVADAAVYAGRTLHERLKQEEEKTGEWTSLELSSETLGLVGRVDCLRHLDGSLIPYEHKRGRPWRNQNVPAPWPNDAVQITAYGMLLEEQTGKPVPEGRIRYHKENVTVRVPLDAAARQAVLDAVARARELRKSTARPPVAPNDRACIRCSLAPVCLPEEERLVSDPTWEPLRLFPEQPERKTIHVVELGSRVGRTGDALKVDPPEGDSLIFPIHEVESVVLHGFSQITTQALHFCAANDVSVHFLSGGGRYVGCMTTGPGKVQRRIRQFTALSDQDTCLRLAKRVVMAKTEIALRYLLRSSRGMDRDATGLTASIETLRSCLKDSAHAESPDELRGHEGLASRAYFAGLPALFREDVPREMRFVRRSRRPPRDRFNALLGFGYALLYQTVLQAIMTVGLEPAFGFYHRPRSAAHPLVLDIMELFRLLLWDLVLMGSVNRLRWSPREDFVVAPGRVWLSNAGKKKAIELFESRLTEMWKHPVIGYALSYARLVELEVRLLEKEWTGKPGLFAKMGFR